MNYLIPLIPPFINSIINYFDKFLVSNQNINPTALTIYNGLFAFLSGFIIFLFTGYHFVEFNVALLLFLSGFFSVFMVLLYYKALSLDEASRVGPLFQFAPVMVIILSYFFLDEVFSFKQYAGCFMIIIAGFLLSVRKLKPGLFKINKAFWYMFAASLLLASVFIFFKIGLGKIGFWMTIPYEGLGNGIGALIITFYGKNFALLKSETKKIPKKIFAYLTLSEALYRVSRYTLYFALIMIPASIVSVLQGFQSFFLVIEGIILSLWFPNILKEVVSKQTISLKILAVVCIFAGLYLIFL